MFEEPPHNGFHPDVVRQPRHAGADVNAVDEKGETAAGFLERAVRWFAEELGVRTRRLLTDNGSCYRSKVFRETREKLGARHGFTRPYRPRTNGKAAAKRPCSGQPLATV